MILIRTPRDLGALIRGARKRRKLGQEALASRIGVSRQWVVEIEKGKPRAEIGLVLRTLDALDISLAPAELPTTASLGPDAVDIDRIVAEARLPRR